MKKRFESLERPVPPLPERAPKGKASRFEGIEPEPGAPAAAHGEEGEEPRWRFQSIEIGQGAPPPRRPARPGKVRCGACGMLNDRSREACWGCASALRQDGSRSKQGEVITLLLDGTLYRSDDPELPRDMRVLMNRIRREGYSEELVADWRSWRATRAGREARGRRAAGEDGAGPGARPGIEAFQAAGRWYLVINGRVYRSGEAGLDPEVEALFRFLAKRGLTPETMEYLRGQAGEVLLHPATAGEPSARTVDFWERIRRFAAGERG